MCITCIKYCDVNISSLIASNIYSIYTAPHNDIYIYLSDIVRILGLLAKTHYIGSTHYFERTISGTVLYYQKKIGGNAVSILYISIGT